MQLIYFIQSGGELGPVKIGYTKNLMRRLENLQSGNPELLRVIGVFVVQSQKKEFSLHRQFASHHLRGEWFTYSNAIQEYVGGLDISLCEGFNKELEVWLSNRGKVCLGKEMRNSCKVCNKIVVNHGLRKGRCSTCAMYFRNHKTERPSHLIRNEFPRCHDCNREYDFLSKGRCPTCALYFRQHQVVRSRQESDQPHPLKTCSGCKKTTHWVCKGLCVACYSYQKKYNISRSSTLIDDVKNQKISTSHLDNQA